MTYNRLASETTLFIFACGQEERGNTSSGEIWMHEKAPYFCFLGIRNINCPTSAADDFLFVLGDKKTAGGNQFFYAAY